MRDLKARNRDLLRLISELAKSLRCLQQDEVFCQGITFTQFYILNAVAQKSKLSLSDLHEILAVEKSTTTRLLYPLEKQGLVSRERTNGDLRAHNLKLTQRGAMTHQKVLFFQSKLFDAFENLIPKRNRKSVYRAVRLFSHALKHCCVPECTSEECISQRMSLGRKNGRAEK